MKNDVSMEMLQELNAYLAIEGSKVRTEGAGKSKSQLSPLMKSLLGITLPSEDATEVAKVRSALTYLSSGVRRGTGSFYDKSGAPVPDHWIAVIWALAGTGWQCGKQIAREWSLLSPDLFDEAGFEKAWNDFKPDHPNPVGLGSLYKRAMEFGWSGRVALVTEPDAKRYKLLGRAEIHAQPAIAWRVKGVIPASGLAALYGPSASGKSFLSFDMAAAIASGSRWFGHRVNASPVVYTALEGEAGFKLRVSAWEKEHNAPLPANLTMVLQAFKLSATQDVQDLASAVPQGAVIFIDTLNRAAPTSDENSSKDMGEILEAAKMLQTLTNGLVILIHHTGKDASKGARGHSSFFAALDGGIEVERNAERRLWRIAKVKDGVDGLGFLFKLKVHQLGQDADGDMQTSCTVEPDTSLLFAIPEPSGKNQKRALHSVRAAIRSSSITGMARCGATTACLKVEDGVLVVAGTLTTVAANKRTNQARKLVTDLVTSGHLESGLQGDEGWIWLP